MKLIITILLLVLVNLLVADTPVPGGTIDGDTWTSENSPYIVNGDLTIENLTIEAGVEIIFTDKYKFEVNRILQAQGFYTDSIYFKPATSNPDGWEGIKFKNTSIASALSYCRIEGGIDQGVFIDQVTPEISNCRIVYNDGDGISLKETDIEIKHCIISHNTLNGVRLNASQISASNSIISGNTLNGILSTNNNDAVTLVNTVITENQDIGISSEKADLTVKNSIVFNNNQQIFIVEQTPDVTYSAIQGATIYPGTGNINSLPDFDNANLYTLSPSSPCVDAGNPTAAYNDKYFPPSLGGTRNDMGAYGGPEAFGWYPPLYVKPQNIQFGKVSQDSSKSISAHILNYRNSGIAVSEILFQGDDSLVFASDKQNFFLPVSDSTEVMLSFFPDQESEFVSNLVLRTLSHGDVYIPVKGEGIVPKMNIMLAELEFDQVPLGSSAALYLPILNSGSDTLRLNMILLSSSVFTLSESSLLIGPNSSLDSIEVTFEPNLPTNFEDSLIIFSNDPENRRIAIPVEGEGTGPSIYLNPEKIDFGTVSVFSDTSFYLTIGNSGNDQMNIDSLNIIGQHPDSVGFAIINKLPDLPLIVAPDGSVLVQIGFTPIKTGMANAQVLIKSNDPFRQEVSAALSGTGIAGFLDLSASELIFDEVSLDSVSVRDLTLKNTGADVLIIDSLHIAGQQPDSLVFKHMDTNPEIPFTLNPNDSVIVQITFSPIRAGMKTARLIIRSNDPFKEEVSIALRGTGIVGFLDLSASGLNFSEVPLNSESLLDLTLKNTGTDVLIIDSLHIAGQHPDSLFFELMDTNPEIPFTLNPDDSVIVQIGFSPIRAGMIAASLIIKSNDPSKEEVSIPLSGTGIAGALILSATQLNFGQVPLNTQSILDLTLSNAGADALTIDSLHIIGQHPDSAIFNLIDTILELPYKLEADSSVTVQIAFIPVSTGEVNAQVLIKSSDPLREEELVVLSGTGIAAKIVLSTTEMDFGQVSLESDSLKTFYIHNKGMAELFISSDSLFITGTHQNSYSLENITEDIFVMPDDSAAITINFQPAQTGINQADLRIRSNDPVDSLLIVQLTGIGYDTSPVSVTFDQLLSTNPFTSGQSATISFIISGSQSTDSAFVYVRSSGTLSYTKLSLNKYNIENWSAEIDAPLVTERGVEYYVHVHHGPISTYHPIGGSEMPGAVQVAVPQIQFPWQTKKEIYQMISIPLVTSGQDLKTLFQDQLGPYDNTQYRIYDLPDGLQYKEVESMDKSLPPGKAIWLITKEVKDLSIANAQSVLTTQYYELQLQKGWNLIATPFAFPVAWSQVSTELALRYYDGSDWPFVTLLEPFKGYAVNAPNDTLILIPPQQAPTMMKSAKTDQNQKFPGWRVQISAKSENTTDLFNYVGASEQTTHGIDYYDYPEPLPIGDFISLYLIPDDTSEKYSTDYRATGMDQYVFEFEVSGNIEQQIKVIFQEENLPEYYDWIVISEEKGIYYPQRIIQQIDKQTRYKMIIGTEQYIAAAKSNFKQLPLTYHLEQNYPNPFNPSTTIKFGLPEVSNVTMNIYNILGQKINSILQGVKMEAGYHQLEWNGKNESGAQVSSGIYFLQLKTEVYNHYIKMILSR